MFEFLEQQFKTNQFLAGAIGGGIFWYLVSFLQHLYALASRLYHRWCVYTIRINNEASIYVPCLNYCFNKVSKKIKNINLQKADNETIKVPGYDWHFFFEGFNFVYFIIMEEKQEMGKERREFISIKVHGLGGKGVMDRIYKNILEEEKIMFEKQYIFKPCYYGDGWQSVKKTPDRDLSTIHLDKDIKSSIIAKLDRFFDSNERFNKIGIKHKTGFVFYGEPGVGKSTLIQALASKYKKNLCYLNLSSVDEKKLEGIFSFLPENAFLIFEDIDCHSQSVNREKEENNVATLLQCLDGVNLPEGTVLFATTNKIENIDSAVLRDGRFDYRIELLPATKEVAKEMIESINPDKLHLLDELDFPIPQCKLQTLLLEE